MVWHNKSEWITMLKQFE